MEEQIQQILERLTRLEQAVFKAPHSKSEQVQELFEPLAFDYSLNERAFMNSYATGLNGQQTFVLICAYMAQGEEHTEVGVADIRMIWDKCAGIIGYPYRSMYSTRAKDAGWVDTPKDKMAVYHLRKSWLAAVKKS